MEEGYTEEGTPFLFQDDYLDPDTSLYLMQARWYDPSSSAFLSPDPEMGDPSDPQRRLPYAYCASDPVGNRDPTGKTFRDLMSAMKNPALARVMVKNQALVLALLVRKPGRKASLWGGMFSGNKERAEERSERSSWPFIEVEPRDFNQPFSMEDALSRFSFMERVIVAGAMAFWRGERLDPFFKLFGIDKKDPKTLPEFLEEALSSGKESLMARVAANFAKLPFGEKLLVTTCYNPITQEFDLEKFQALSELYMFYEIHEADYMYKKAADRGDVGMLLAAMVLRVKANVATAWTIDRTLGPVVLRELVHSAQLLNYAVVEPERWEETVPFGSIPGTPLYDDPIYKRFQNTVLSNAVDVASDFSTFFTITDVFPWQVLAR